MTVASIREQFRPQLKLVLFLAPVVLALGGLALVRKFTGIPLPVFMEDPAATSETPFYVGIVSNVGILLWCAAAAICFFCAAILFRARADKNQQTFFLCSGLMLSVLLLDDLFMLHESVLPDYLGIPQNLVQASYAVMALLYVWRFWKMIFNAEHAMLFMAFAFLGFSVLCDVVHFRVPAHELFEEGSKLLGITSFLIYFAKEGMHHVNAMLKQSALPQTIWSEPIDSFDHAVGPQGNSIPRYPEVNALVN